MPRRARPPVQLAGAIILALMVIAGCSPGEAPSRPSPLASWAPSSPAASPVPSARPLAASPHPPSVFRIARIPFRSARTLFNESEELFTGLAVRLGVDRIDFSAAPDYDGVVDLLESGQVDAAWLGTAAYVKARRRAKLGQLKDPPVPVAMPIRDGRTYYQGVIVVRKDSRIDTLAALKGKRVAFVDPESASGYVFAKRLLESAGVRVPQDLATAVPGSPDFLQRHDAVVMAVYLKKFDAGAVFDDALDEMFQGQPDKARELIVLARTPRIPSEPIVMRASASKEARDKLAEALLLLPIPPSLSGPMGHLTGFARASVRDYAAIAKAMGEAP